MPVKLSDMYSISAGGHELQEPDEYYPHTTINFYGLPFEDIKGEVQMLEPEIIKYVEIRNLSRKIYSLCGS